MKKEVVIVGGGPAGLSVALHIRRKDVVLIEEHEKIGLPKHCAGIVGYPTFLEISRISPKLINNSYKNVVFVSPRRKYTVYSKYPLAFHVDRPGLEEILASKVESVGHRIVLKTKAKPCWPRAVMVGDAVLEYETLIVAEGARGAFRETLGQPFEYLYGLQIVAKTVDVVPNDTLVILFSEFTPEFFSWIIPIDGNLVKMGLASRSPRKEHVFRVAEKKLGLRISSVVEEFGGLIPVHKPLKNPVIYGNAVFHGDAVPLIKPYTGGGLGYILKLSPLLASHVDNRNLRGYGWCYLKAFYAKNNLERLIVRFLRKMNYCIPVPVVSAISKLGLMQPIDFDEHLKIAFKTLALAPILLPFLYYFQDTAPPR